MISDIEKGDADYNRGLVNMNDILQASSVSRNASRFHMFKNPRAAKRGYIHVQTTAPSRRVHKNGSRVHQDTAKKNKSLAHRPVSTKRPHNTAMCIANNWQIAKKAGRHMISHARYNKKKQQKE